ncbi:3-keto-steroid reductase NDAI_0B02550 [Naumovozyma dairenensis CBS 421]|uniref:3beta-hydroxysteroid 3-dehydrogenase n=1 Tax=Naumovozyma dairenensis (strain ATCC 10597 / BCRC 20456 / CBS 421 / NBRC 0211 / NRRL Y-12639) TaxID=1071378 RepID=G0W679_NAUDC|nr:hypothetical protein NDAI_0B02550 [Naumovozyma dairenensis CBS 421]CCD23290.1 hypothetical protein NDAI_0B02550 [Naumovozyma dairenensis CBS 421]
MHNGKVVDDRKVIVITGTNSNLGLNIAYRFIDTSDKETRLTFVVTSRTLPRVKEAINLIKAYTHKSKRTGIVDYDYFLVDFTNMVSVLNAYYELTKTYDAIHYFFVNAAQGVYDGIDWVGAMKEVIANPLEAVTNPTYKMQKVGVKSKDNMGLVFQANVFGPYYLLHKLLPLLSAGNGTIIWISSIMSGPKYLSLQDIELLRTDSSYEGSKRLVDLLHLATYKELKSMGIHQYIVQPGIFTSHSFFKYLNVFTFYGMLLLFYIARIFLGSKWHNISGYKAANAPIYVALEMDKSNYEGEELKYGSATTRSGKEYIKAQEIIPIGSSDVYDYIKLKEKEWDEKLKGQITNTRIPM